MAKEMTRYITKNYPGIQFETLMSKTGASDSIAWMAKFETFADAAVTFDKIYSDPDFMAINRKYREDELGRGRSMWVGGWNDSYWHVLDPGNE
jgi:hypothetical protein